MSASLTESPLTSAHLDDVLSLEDEYPSAFRLGRSVLQKKLATLDTSGCSLAWILHHQGRCVGYVVAYPQFSRLEQNRKERVIYVDDVFVSKGYEACLFRLIKLFTRQARELGLRDCPIEGVCRVSAYTAFTRHDQLLQRLGWQLSQKSEYWDDTVREELCWLRWEPLYESESTIDTGDRITVSREEDDDFEARTGVVTLADSEQYAYVPGPREAAEEEEADEYQALTEIMLGKGEDDLVAIVPEPPVNPKELLDVFGILEFFGSRSRPRSSRIMSHRKT